MNEPNPTPPTPAAEPWANTLELEGENGRTARVAVFGGLRASPTFATPAAGDVLPPPQAEVDLPR